ncbi:MAG: NfeD family protein [Phycisphaeraceae bacterium]
MTGNISNVRLAYRLLLLASLAVLLIAQTPGPAPGPAPGPGPDAAPASSADAEKIVYVIPIRGEINNLTVNFIEWGLSQSQPLNRAAVVLDIDTPGGLVSSAIDICRKLKSLQNERIVAWVHSEAISAGSMISLACDEIVITERGKLGDCAAIMVGPQGLQSLGTTERAKIDSYILAEFRDSAKLRGYPLPLAESMVTLGPAVYRIINTSGGGGGGGGGEKKIIFADELKTYGLDADQPNDISPDGWKIEKRLVKQGTLLTMAGEEAIDFGFAKAFVNDDAALLKYLNLPGAGGRIERFEPNWSQALFGWLTTPAIRGILTLIVILAIYFEFQSPGLGAGAIVAVVAGALLLGAPYLTGMANMWELLIVLLGAVLLFIEIFITPGFGVLGISGLLLIFLGLLLTFVPAEPGPGFIPQLPGTWNALTTGFFTLLTSFLIAICGMIVLAKYFGSIPVLNRLILKDPPPDPPTNDLEIIGGKDTVHPGDTGHALNDLRPAGRASFGQLSVDVVTDGSWIEAGSPVTITTIAGNRVVVRKT